jgi:hypothetical protein
MKSYKFASFVLLTILMICAFAPELSARGHHRNHYHTKKYRSSYTSFGFNLNLNPTPNYYTSTYVVQPPVYERVTYVQPQPVSYYYYPQYEEVIVQRQRPTYYSSPQVYVQPQFSYWNY